MSSLYVKMSVADAKQVAYRMYLNHLCAGDKREEGARQSLEQRAFLQVFDANHDGLVTLSDFEELCVRYFCNDQYPELYPQSL